MECTSKTLKGSRCKNSAIKGTDKCKTHSKNTKSSTTKKLKKPVSKKDILLPSKTKMSKKTFTLKEDLLNFVGENIIDLIINDGGKTANEMVFELLLLKVEDQWKDLNVVKDTVFGVTPFPPWMLEGLTPSNKLVSKQLEKVSLELQAIFKAHAKDPKPKKSNL